MSSSRLFLVLVALVALVLAGCGPAGSASPSPMPTGTGMGEDVGALGEPAAASEAQRTIHIVGDDELEFDPAVVEVSVGEVVTFEIENSGTVDHEFVLGDAEYQDEHEAEMQGGGMHMAEPNAVEVEAGETATLTWRFTTAGTTLYGCHEPGHYPAGMVGTITVNP